MSTAVHTSASRKPKPAPAKSREELRREEQRLTAEPRKVQRQKLMARVADAGSKPPSKVKITAPPIVTEYMTTQEVAAYLKLSRQFLEGARYRGDGSGPDYIKLGRAVRYRRSVLDAWMSANIHPSDTPVR
jgi:predicted DNA-binding transcriptional regulator AlpA